MKLQTKLCGLLKIDFPLIQAGMGGVANPFLVSEVCNSGCAGTLGLYKMKSKQIEKEIKETYHLLECKKNPIGVNIIPELISENLIIEQINTLDRIRKSINFFLLFYGLPSRSILNSARMLGCPILVQIGSYEDFVLAIENDFDAIVVQGIEAGGHLLGDEKLLDISNHLFKNSDGKIIIASGGIGDGRKINELIDIGFEGVLCGTIFASTKESGAHLLYKNKIVNSTEKETIITDLFRIGWEGRRHRVIKNKTTATELRKANFIATTIYNGVSIPLPRYSSVLPNSSTSGHIDEMAMYCGTSCNSVQRISSSREVITKLKSEFYSAVNTANCKSNS